MAIGGPWAAAPVAGNIVPDGPDDLILAAARTLAATRDGEGAPTCRPQGRDDDPTGMGQLIVPARKCTMSYSSF